MTTLKFITSNLLQAKGLLEGSLKGMIPGLHGVLAGSRDT
jgi:hypothetical protein